MGEASDIAFNALLEGLPLKRVEVPADLNDPSRLGPGHLSTLELVRKRAKAESDMQVQARRRAAWAFEQQLKYVRPPAKSKSRYRILY